MNNTPYTEPCKDPRHTGRIREQLGCNGPDPAGLTAQQAIANAATVGITAALAGRAAGIREAADAIDNNDRCDCGGCGTCILRAHAADFRAHADRVEAQQQPNQQAARRAMLAQLGTLAHVAIWPHPAEDMPENTDATAIEVFYGGLGRYATAYALRQVADRLTDAANADEETPLDTDAVAAADERNRDLDAGVPATADVFTEAAVSRSALLAGADVVENLPQDYECDPGRGDAVKALRRLADHYTTNEQPAGLTWEARTEHAVRLYATTAIERDDARTEAATLRARVAELEQPTDGTERAEDTARRFARRLAAVEQLCNGRPGYHSISVKQLLTAMSDTDDGPDPVSDDDLAERISTAVEQYLDDAGEVDDTADLADNLLTVIKQAGR